MFASIHSPEFLEQCQISWFNCIFLNKNKNIFKITKIASKITSELPPFDRSS